jgi:hypothetical protein
MATKSTTKSTTTKSTTESTAKSTAKATIKTMKTEASVGAFLDAVPDPVRRDDAKAVCKLMQHVTGEAPAMWGTSIIGFGHRTIKYDSGRELDWMVVGLSPRKANTVIYIMDGYDKYQDHLARLGKHKKGQSCLYVSKLSDIDMKVLEQMIRQSVRNQATR